jgi:dTDP-4-dehydrorhamnose reductase
LPLFKGWIEVLKNGGEIAPFKDMVMAPVPISLVTGAMTRIAEQRAGGIFQASASRDVSYAEAARHIACRLGAHPALVRPNTADAGIPTPDVPCYTTLDATRLGALLGRTAPDPFEVIDAVFQLLPERVTAI